MLYILFSDICPLRNCHVDSISEIFGFQGYVRLAPRFKKQCARTAEAVSKQTMASFTILAKKSSEGIHILHWLTFINLII